MGIDHRRLSRLPFGIEPFRFGENAGRRYGCAARQL
jgi:hypothetical protein